MKHHPASPGWGLSLFGNVCHQTLFSTPKAPVIPPPAVMPTPDSAGVNVAKKKALMAAATRTGRSSTILTDYGSASTDKLGG
jgi:hypothetical protein